MTEPTARSARSEAAETTTARDRWPFSGTGHVLTIDVEEYFQSPAFDGAVCAGDWDYLPDRVGPSVDLWLDLLETHGIRATFFVLGWVADRNPEAVRRIADSGHEVASMGWGPALLDQGGSAAVLEGIRRAKERLEAITGRPVHGFRMPRTLRPAAHQALLDALIEGGHVYDSTVSGPASRSEDVAPSATPYIVTRPAGRILEIPTGGLSVGPFRVAGPNGARLRHLPYAVTRRSLIARRAELVWSLLRLRSWEIDADQPYIPLPPISRFRHYWNLGRFREKVGKLFSEFRFASVADRLGLDREVPGSGEDRDSDGLAATSGPLRA